GEVGPQPVQGLLPPPGPLWLIGLGGVFALPAAGAGRSAGGVIAVAGLRSLSKRRLGGECLLVEAGCGPVKPLEEADLRERDPVRGRGLGLAPQDRRELPVEFDQALTVAHPLGRRIAPPGVLGAERMASLHGGEGFAELPGSLERVAEV